MKGWIIGLVVGGVAAAGLVVAAMMESQPTPPPKVGGVAPGAQQIKVYWGKTASASKSGSAVVTAPGTISSVDMGGAGTAVVSGKTATLTFNGTAGTVTVYGGAANIYTKPIQAQIVVS